MTTSIINPTIYFQFNIIVTLKGEDGKTYIGNPTVSLSEVNNSPITGITSQQATLGIAIFTISMSTPGLKEFASTCSTITGSLSVTVLDLKLKINSFTPKVKYN